MSYVIRQRRALNSGFFGQHPVRRELSRVYINTTAGENSRREMGQGNRAPCVCLGESSG